MKQVSIQNKILITGGVLVAVFNPLSVNLWADALDIALQVISEQLIHISNYTVVIGGTLILVGLVLSYAERSKKQTTKLKKMSKKPTAKAGEYIDY